MIAGISGSSYAVGAGMVVNAGTTRVRVLKSGSTTVWYGSQDMAAPAVPTTCADYAACRAAVRDSIMTVSNANVRENLDSQLTNRFSQVVQYPQEQFISIPTTLNDTWTNTIMARAVINTSTNLTTYRNEMTNFELASQDDFASTRATLVDVGTNWMDFCLQILDMISAYGGSTTSGTTGVNTFTTALGNSDTQAATWTNSTATNIAKNKVTLGM